MRTAPIIDRGTSAQATGSPTWKQGIRDFFFLPGSPLPFTYLRLGVALVLFFKLLKELGSILDIYGNHGMIPWVISEVASPSLSPSASMFAKLGQLYGLSEDGCVYLLVTLFSLGLVGLLLGIQTRASALLSWFTHLALTSSTAFNHYGVDMFANIALFYCAIMPQSHNSRLFWLKQNKDEKASLYAKHCLRLLQFHLCVVYLSAGIEKCLGDQWWNGEAIWRALMMPQFSVFDMSWLANYSWIPFTLGLGTLILEVGYAIFIWSHKTRPIWLGLIISLHLGIGLFLGLWAFAFMMIVLNIAAFGSEYLESFLATTRQWIQALRSRSSAPIPTTPPI